MTSKIDNQSLSEDTICAVATAQGIGSISIIRVSGQDALAISSKLFKQNTKLTPRYASLKEIYDKKSHIIDTALVIYFSNPKSFTGEDIVEFQCHGGSGVASIVLDTLLFHGARLAQNGEFSKRAFLNGKIDLSQAEAISKLIEAKSDEAVKLLARQLKGELIDFVEMIRKELIFVIASSEVSIDYADEDLPKDLSDSINDKLNSTLQILNNTLRASLSREGMLSGYKIAIVGKPNVGKSSLLNRLLSFNRAIVSDISGTTRDTIEENLKIGTHLIKIIDTAGIRDTKDEIEKIGIQKSLEAIDEADIIIALFDRSSKLDDEDKQMLKYLNETQNKHIIYTLNKSDLEDKLDFDTISQNKSIEISTKDNIDILIQNIEDLLDTDNSEDETILVSKRQILALQTTIKSLEDSFILLANGELELFSFHITEAIEAISSISRPYEYSDLLDSMFGNFCLGK
jgi:tRNA modification GTPase